VLINYFILKIKQHKECITTEISLYKSYPIRMGKAMDILWACYHLRYSSHRHVPFNFSRFPVTEGRSFYSADKKEELTSVS